MKNINIAVCCFCTGSEYKKSVEKCLQSHENYRKLHKYDYITDESIYDSSRPPSWSKIKLIEKYLPMYDYLFWIDADAMFTNYEILLEDKIVPLLSKEKFLLLGVDPGINFGVFLIKNDPISYEFLNDVWNSNVDINNSTWEQLAVQELAKTEKYESKIELVENRVFNSYHNEKNLKEYEKYTWVEGDFIVHFAGFSKDKGLDDIQKKYYKDI